MNDLPLLVPMPKEIHRLPGTLCPDRFGYLSIDDRALYPAAALARDRLPWRPEIVVGRYADAAPVIALTHDGALRHEAYTLTVDTEGIRIGYGDAAGAFYALMTLAQLTDGTAELPCLSIRDEPAFALRGYMWDISRCRIPKTETILRMVDRLAALKVNHLELYIEGAPFAYRSQRALWRDRDMLTGEDLMRIDEYCRARFIEFVPTHNTFGHMAEWLTRLPRDMAMCPDGYQNAWTGETDPPSSLDPFGAGCMPFLRTISDDLLSNFTADRFNVCCDEVNELGQGSTAGLPPERLGRVYLDHLLRLHAYCRQHGKQMLFWGDIILHYPDLIAELPHDVIALNWGYESELPTEDSCASFAAAGIPFCVCPGTGTWKTFVGKTEQMRQNIRGAAEKGLRHGAMGLLLTDWGDNGHLQGLYTAMPGLVYVAALAWDPAANADMDLSAAVSGLIYRDRSGACGRFALDVGMYHTLEPMRLDNQTLTEKLLFWPLTRTSFPDLKDLCAAVKDEDLDRVTAHMRRCAERLAGLDLSGIPDGEQVRQEYRLGIRAVELAQECGRYKLAAARGDAAGARRALSALCDGLPQLICGYEVAWQVRDRYAGLDRALAPLRQRLSEARDLLASAENGQITN